MDYLDALENEENKRIKALKKKIALNTKQIKKACQNRSDQLKQDNFKPVYGEFKN